MNVFGFASAVTLARSIGQIGRRASVPLAAIAIAAVVAGCAAPAGPRSDDLVCNSAQQCRVTVRVDCNPGCTASVDHPRVMPYRRGGGRPRSFPENVTGFSTPISNRAGSSEVECVAR